MTKPSAAANHVPSKLSNLPPELISEVVRYLDVSRFCDKFVFSSICSHWRRTVIADQWIWADISLNIPPQSVELLSLALSRTGQTGLSVGIFFEYGATGDVVLAAFEYLRRCTATVRHLRLEFMFLDQPGDFLTSGSDFPELQSLILAVHGGPPVSLNLTMPKLQYIEVNSRVPFSQWTPLVGSSLSTVILKEEVSIIDFWNFYKDCADRRIPLAHLEIENFFDSFEVKTEVYGRMPIYLPTIRRLDMSSGGVGEIRRTIPTESIEHLLVFDAFPDNTVYNLWQIWRPEGRPLTRISVTPAWEIDLEGTCPELPKFKRSIRIGLVNPETIHVDLVCGIKTDITNFDSLTSVSIPLRLWEEFIEFTQDTPFAAKGLRMEFFFEGSEPCTWAEGLKAKCPKLEQLVVRPFRPVRPLPRIAYGALKNIVGTFGPVEKDAQFIVRGLSMWSPGLPDDSVRILRRLFKVHKFLNWRPTTEEFL